MSKTMGKSHYLTLLCFFNFMYVPGFGYECPYKECLCVGIAIICANRGFNSVPQVVSINTAGLTYLTLDWNQITVISDGSLPSNLTELSLEYNPITTIDETAFDGSANTLETLSFRNSRFAKIPDALLHLKVLKQLSIYDTNIFNWNMNVMKNIGLTLESMYINNAGNITSPTWIQYFSNLTELTMESCFVSDLPDNAFDQVINRLTTLSFFNNSLIEVPKALSKLRILTELTLGNNQISNITWLPQSKLSIVTLNNNYISDAYLLSRTLLPSTDSVTSLTLEVNKLNSIPNFGYLSNVTELDFTYNRISDPYSGSLPPNVFALDFGNNFLPAIPRAASNLTQLTDMTLTSNVIKVIKDTDIPLKVNYLALGNNLITELTDTSFPQNSAIQYLHLNNNPISKISDLAFTKLLRLTYLDLRETKITRLPLALTSLSSLSHFDATDITDLVCTCMEKSLRRILAPLLPGDVLGDCGQTSIYNFFANFASGCPST